MTENTVSPGGNLQDPVTGEVLYVHGGMVYEPGLSAYETRRIAGQIPLERFDNDDPVAVVYRHVSRVVERLGVPSVGTLETTVIDTRQLDGTRDGTPIRCVKWVIDYGAVVTAEHARARGTTT